MNITENLCLSLLPNCKNLNSIKQLHAFVFKTGFESDPYIIGKLLLHCAIQIADDALIYAKRLIFHASNPDVFMYNTLIRGFAESDSPGHSLTMFTHMLKNPEKFSPDSFSFAFTLKAAANMRCLIAGSQLHCKVIAHGYDTHIFVGTTLISLYAECGEVGFARMVFDEMREPNIVAWNAIVTAYFRCHDLKGAEKMYDLMPFRNLTSMNLMLAGYAKVGEVDLAKKLFSEMETRNDVSWSTMIVGFAHNGFFGEAFGCLRQLLRAGMRPSEVSLTGVLSACAQAGALEFGKILHGFVEKSGLNYVIAVSNALLDAYCKCGNVDMARLVFERIPGRKNVVSWTTLIAGLAMQGYGEEAIRLFNRMEDYGIRPDGVTFISILYACSHAGFIGKGCEIFDKMTKVYGIEPEMEHYGCMVDLYGRAGQLQRAYDFVVEMPIQPNDIIWRTLLGACSFFGNIELAEQVKEKLSELDPDNSGDHVLLSNVYAAVGKWKDVVAVRKTMAEQKLKKTPGWSMIEVSKVMYSFVAGARLDEISEEANRKLNDVILKVKVEGGYIPEVTNVLHDIEDEEKEDSLTTHSEKLAVAFGIARLPEGKVIRIVKNLRVCKDCHTVMKLISKVYRVEIVVRDRSRFHSFKEGSCSCRDYW